MQQITVKNAYKIGEPYEGEYIVTPSQQQQILPTKDKVLTENVVVEPISSRSFTTIITLDHDVTNTELLVSETNSQLASIRSLETVNASIVRTEPDITNRAINAEIVTNMYHGASGYSGVAMVGTGSNMNVFWNYYKLDFTLHGFGGLYLTDSGQIGIGASPDAFLTAGTYVITVSW